MNLTIIEGKRNLMVQAPRIEEDIPKWEDINQINMDEFMHVQICDDSIVYSCPKFISLAKRLKDSINEFDFHMIIAQIARAYKVVHHIGMTSENVVWNPEFVFMSPTTREMKFILLLNKEENDTTFQSLLEEVIYSVKQSNMDDSYVSEFVYHLKRLDAFDYNDILSYITEFDSKVTRLLQLKKPISYEMPESQLSVSEFKTVEAVQEEAEEVVESFEEEDPEEVVSVVVEEPVEMVPEETTEEPEQEETVSENEEVEQETLEVNEDEAVVQEEIVTTIHSEEDEQEEIVSESEETIVEAEEKTATKLSFADMFEEGSDNLIRDEDNDYFDEYEESSKHTFEGVDTLIEKETNPEFDVEYYLVRASSGEQIPIDKDEFFLGKSSYIDGYAVKGNPAVSRKHALIQKENEKYMIQDLGSVNGTYVNHEEVGAQKKTEIHDGDLIELADERFIFKEKSND